MFAGNRRGQDGSVAVHEISSGGVKVNPVRGKSNSETDAALPEASEAVPDPEAVSSLFSKKVA